DQNNTGSCGIVLIGGLYWKRGTTAGAWAAVFTGSILSAAGLIICRSNPNFPINEPVFFFIACMASSIVYFSVSLLRPAVFDMDRMLHRGKYEIKADVAEHAQKISWLSRKLGITREFTRGDKLAYLFIILWNGFWIGVFVVFNLINILFDVKETVWAKYWEISNWLFLIMGVLSTIWFTCGGLIDIRQMFKDLKTSSRNDDDDGVVVNHSNLDEVNR
ncbi:MAG: hypothetical protein U9P12_04550, partial [Verrucomicrobiota bacterium]|nr:hypothetical protein [Verrucomicrobiota bacterium]